MKTQVVLVTGASSGIGRAIAVRLAGAGHTVFGTSRNPAAAEAPPGVEMVEMDVRDDGSVRGAVERVLERAGRIDVLVNNAGMVVAGALEEVTDQEARTQFETNVFGVLRVTRAVLPGMRQRRDGLVINVGSVAGIVPIPFAGLYSMPKFAIEGMTEVLRTEVAPFGIRVALLEPGFFRTGLVQSTVRPERPIPAYDATRNPTLGRVTAIEEAAPPPAAIADRVLRLVADPAPRLRHPIGKEKLFVTLKRFLPESQWEGSSRKYWGLGRA